LYLPGNPLYTTPMTTDCHPFASFGLSDTILDALTQKGFTAPSSIQTIALPRLLADKGHLIVKARTGTGKTAAFGIPLVEQLTQGGHAPRALILTPTRELALQIAKEIASLTTGPFPRITAVYGGSSIRNQILDLKRGTEIVVGTPGRLMDLMERKVLDLSAVDWCILDEADEMLDMGFFEDVETILKAVKSERRVALFSATMPEGILRIVRDYIGDVEILEDSAPEDEKPAVDQYYLVVKKEDRLEALRRIIDGADDFYGLIFCATKAGTDELARRLVEGAYAAEAIHGDLSQEARERTLRRFRSRITTILVATDVAARGLDIERLSHVINWDLPNDRETYVHRIGRTGRAGRRGKAISLALPAERGRINHLSRNMERTLGTKIEWMKVPKIKSVMKAIKKRILLSVSAALPANRSPLPINAETDMPLMQDTEDLGDACSPVPPLHAQVSRELIEQLGSEGAVEALIALTFGDMLDPSRYGSITEFQETTPRDEGRGRLGTRRFSSRHDFDGQDRSDHRKDRHVTRGWSSKGNLALVPDSGFARVYVGLGRRHGASARDVAKLLMQAGGIPGRLVDAIEMKDYCAFATLPEDAARRACTFSRKTPDNPAIKPASAPQ
jgi:ATP-dependent RNA helicase DeaD